MNILFALLCVISFAMTAPFTRIAALEISAESIIFIRILGAALVCIAYLALDRWIPPRKAWKGILFTAIGSVIGFNCFMAFGMREVPAGHAAVALAALPVVTAIYSSIRDRLNPGINFWIFALLGTTFSIGYFFSLNVGHILMGDIYLVLGVFCAAFGYVEGGRASRTFGGPRVMLWAILLTAPFIILLSFPHFLNYGHELRRLSTLGWFSLFYVATISQSLGMFLWFKVLAKGPMQKVAMVQLSQPFFTLFGSIVLLGETVPSMSWVIAGLVCLCIVGANRERMKK